MASAVGTDRELSHECTCCYERVPRQLPGGPDRASSPGAQPACGANSTARRTGTAPDNGLLSGASPKVLFFWRLIPEPLNFIYFDPAGPTGDPLDRVKPPAKIRKAAQIQGIRWPHDDWSAAAGQTKNRRHKLTHLLYIDSISGGPSRGGGRAFRSAGFRVEQLPTTGC